jgi:glutamyl-tRNA reductase
MSIEASSALAAPQFNVVGVSHKTMPVEQRERLARFAPDADGLLRSIVDGCSLKEAALISTCNRFEVVAVGDDCGARLKNFFAERLAADSSADSIYALQGSEAVRHLFRVASSLDSMVVGEGQILGQVKDAYERSVQLGYAGRYLHHLFQFAFSLAKKVRGKTAVGAGGVSLSYVAVKLAQQIFGTLSEKSVLVIGSGRMAELAALHLKTYGCREIVVANRTLERAADLAARTGGLAIGLGEIESRIGRADVIISSITAAEPVVTMQQFKRRTAQKPVFLIDLGVPRNIPPGIGELDDVFLYNVDDLQRIADENGELRLDAAHDADVLIEYGLFQFEKWLRVMREEPELLDLRARIRQICHDEVRAALGKETGAGRLGGPEIDEIAALLGHRIAQKVSHEAGEKLRGDALAGDSLEELVERWLKA